MVPVHPLAVASGSSVTPTAAPRRGESRRSNRGLGASARGSPRGDSVPVIAVTGPGRDCGRDLLGDQRVR